MRYFLEAKEDIQMGMLLAICDGMTKVRLVQECHHYAKPRESNEWPIGISAKSFNKGEKLEYDPLEETDDIKFSGDVPVMFSNK